MMRLRFLVPVLGLSSLIAVACGEDGDGGSGAEAGAGGEAPVPGGSGAGGEETSAGGGCSEDGNGTLVIEVEGLPADVAPSVLIEGPEDLLAESVGGAGSTSFEVKSGAYKVTVERVFDEDPLVRKVFEPTLTETAFCLADGDTHTITVNYEMIPSSNKLWMSTALDDELAGFSSFQIQESGMVDADVSIDGPGSTALAFDRDGNLWAVGPTSGDALVARFPAAELGASGTRTPDIAFNLAELDCIPPLSNLAFDPAGNLWLSSHCKGPDLGELHRIPAAELAGASDMRESDVVITGLADNDGLAFDAAGNVWVAGGPSLVKYAAERLEASDSDAPDLALSVTTAVGELATSAIELAFDAGGNLWGVTGDNIIFEIAKANLTGTGAKDVTAKVSFHVDPLAITDAPAFDDSGNLWVSLNGGVLGGFSPAQLLVSKGTGENVIPDILIHSDSVASGLPIIFFPAPAGLPLYHSLPVP